MSYWLGNNATNKDGPKKIYKFTLYKGLQNQLNLKIAPFFSFLLVIKKCLLVYLRIHVGEKTYQIIGTTGFLHFNLILEHLIATVNAPLQTGKAWSK